MDEYEKALEQMDPSSLLFELETELILLCSGGGWQHYDKVRLGKREIIRRFAANDELITTLQGDRG